jgi:DNA-binding NtrC family response regulator
MENKGMRRVCKVLIVEDDDYVRDFLRDFFADEGYRFVVTRDGVEMRQAIKSDPSIDVVVIDLTLPGNEDGLVLARHAVAQGNNVILVSGDHTRLDELVGSGYRFLLKPFRTQALLETIEIALAEARNDCERPDRAPRPDEIDPGL